MALIRGQRHGASYTPDVLDRDINDKIAQVQPDRAPFASFLMRLPMKPTITPKFEHGEDDERSATVTLTANANSGDTVIDLTDGDTEKLHKNHYLFSMERKVLVRVTGIDHAANTVTVERPALSTTDANLLNGDKMVIVEAYQEGVNFEDAITDELSLKSNHVHEIETAIEASWIHQGTRLLVEQDWQYQMQKGVRTHKEKKERIFFASKQGLITGTSGKRLRTTDGMFWLIETDGLAAHKKDLAGAVVTAKDWDDYMSSVVQYGSPDRKVNFVDPAGWLRITGMAVGNLRIPPSEKTLGMTVTRSLVNGRVATLIENQQFTFVGWTNTIITVDMDNVMIRYFASNGKSFKTRWYPNVQDPRMKGQMDVLYSVEGLHIKIAKAHGYFKNFA